MDASRFLTIFGLVCMGIISRLIPHPPNFTAMSAIALFGTLFLGSRSLSLIAVFATLFLSDLALGIHTTLLWVYLSHAIIVLAGYQFKDHLTTRAMPLVSLLTSLLFFLIANFGVWWTSGLYEYTSSGLLLCYVAAIPFMSYQALGTMTYSALLYGVYMSAYKTREHSAINNY